MIDILGSPNAKFSPETIKASVDYYKSVYEGRVTGPQLEGLDGSWVENALGDDRTLSFEIDSTEGGNVVQWPLLVDISHNEDYQQRFFEDRYPGQSVYYLSTPPVEILETIAHTDALAELAARLPAESIVVYEDQEGNEFGEASFAITSVLAEQAGRQVHDVTPDSEAFGNTYGQPKVNHFEIIARNKVETHADAANADLVEVAADLAARGEIRRMPSHGVGIATVEDFQKDNCALLDQMWEMYKGQFENLVEDHPSLQIQPRGELEKMLQDKDTLSIVYMESDKPIAMCYFVSNIDTCIWLNSEHFKQRDQQDDSLKTVYFPGIVVDAQKAQQGGEYVKEMLSVVSKVTEEACVGMRVTFQSTNVSSTYIPSIVERYIDSDEKFDIVRNDDGSGYKKIAQYNYHVLQVA
ncbi:hypothetical protein HY312_01985 [Candidatus Saccharibacteria bacterium]|nr:hypothetical protein [Candidatus Saccharibacteria bacterium]